MNKRGRPVGSKNKPKSVKLNAGEVELCRKMGVTPEEFARAKLRLSRRKKVSLKDPFDDQFAAWAKKVDTDWEGLAKNLQIALAKEIKEGEQKDEMLHRFTGIEHHVNHLESEIEKFKTMLVEQRGVIGYLEQKVKNGNNPV
jgi:hypothetical protein